MSDWDIFGALLLTLAVLAVLITVLAWLAGDDDEWWPW